MTTMADFDLENLFDDHMAEHVTALRAAALRAEYRNVETLTATKTLTDADCPFQNLTASGGNRDARLPLEATTNHVFLLSNVGGSNNIPVKNSTGATTFVTLFPGEWCLAISNGSAWVVLTSRYQFVGATELTISSDAISITQNAHKLQPETGTTDNLATINGTSNGQFGVLYVSDFGTDTITIKHNTGNILCVSGSDISLSNGCVFWFSNGTKIFVVGDGGGAAGLTSGPQAFGDNYVITPSIASNNLTVALKTIAGADPSSSDKISVRIGNTKRDITAAISVTKNAGTNWCSSGSAELAAKEVDYFVYLIQETGASAGTKVGFSRIPWAKTMGDFVNTTTNEKYIAGNWTNFASTDEVENIGRFRAQLSAGAGYTWSIPTAHVKNRPVYETDWLTWAPTYTASGGTPTTVTTPTAKYKVGNKECKIELELSVDNKGTATGTIVATLPFTPAAGTASGGREGNTTGKAIAIGIPSGVAQLQIALYDATTLWVNTYHPTSALFYEI